MNRKKDEKTKNIERRNEKNRKIENNWANGRIMVGNSSILRYNIFVVYCKKMSKTAKENRMGVKEAFVYFTLKERPELSRMYIHK